MTGSGLFCLGRVVLRVEGTTLSQAEGGPKGQLRPVAGEAGGMQPLECSEARLRPGGSCGRPGAGASAAHGERHRAGTEPWRQGRGPRLQRHTGKWDTGSHNTEHEPQAQGHTQPLLKTWTQWWYYTDHKGHTVLWDTCTQWPQGIGPGHRAQGTGKGAFWHDCTGTMRRGGGWCGAACRQPHADPSGGVSLSSTLC